MTYRNHADDEFIPLLYHYSTHRTGTAHFDQTWHEHIIGSWDACPICMQIVYVFEDVSEYHDFDMRGVCHTCGVKLRIPNGLRREVEGHELPQP